MSPIPPRQTPVLSPRPRLVLSRLAALVLWVAWVGALADQREGTDSEAGLPFWAWEEGPVEIRLVQRLPDQTRAFFIGRGFSSLAADRIARNCVFQSIVRNRAMAEAGKVLTIDLTKWRLNAGAGIQPLPSKQAWDQEWVAMGESRAARIAFRWSLLPTRQTFHSGDFNWGMIAFGVPPGTRFDLTLTWTVAGAERGAVLHGLTCAPEATAESNPE